MSPRGRYILERALFLPDGSVGWYIELPVASAERLALLLYFGDITR